MTTYTSRSTRVGPPPTGTRDAATARCLSLVSERLAALKYGQITITVHDGHIVQVEASEKTRFVPEQP